jgi:hypothetical protein
MIRFEECFAVFVILKERPVMAKQAEDAFMEQTAK